MFIEECPSRCFKIYSGYWLLATGYWRQVRSTSFLRLILVSLLMSSFTGCDGMSPESSIASQPTTAKKSLKVMRYDGGFVFADREHVVGIDVAAWSLESLSQVQTIRTSCECVRASVRELGNGPRKIILVAQVAADAKMSRNTSLAVEIEAILADESKKVLSFEFTHVAIPATNGKD